MNPRKPKETPEAKEARYQAWLQRPGPTRLGEVDWPKSRPGALSGQKFVVTGEMETIGRQELVDTIKASGGRVLTGVSKNVDHMFVGRDPGPSKLSQAAQLDTHQLSEGETYRFLSDAFKGKK